MIWRFDGGTAETNTGMASDAVRIGSFERAGRMTSLATHIRMRSVQVESGTEMVEWLLCQQLRRHHGACEN